MSETQKLITLTCQRLLHHLCYLLHFYNLSESSESSCWSVARVHVLLCATPINWPNDKTSLITYTMHTCVSDTRIYIYIYIYINPVKVGCPCGRLLVIQTKVMNIVLSSWWTWMTFKTHFSAVLSMHNSLVTFQLILNYSAY